MFKRMSIRMRVTLLVALVLIFICTALTVGIYGLTTIKYSSSEAGMMNYVGVMPSTDGESIDTTENIEVEISVTDPSAVIMGVLVEALWIMLLCILIGIFAVWFVVKLALRPVTELSCQIAKINEQRLSHSVTVPPSKDELSELAVSFNNMLARLNFSFDAQKRFSATAAHELKTPLSSIITNVEVLELDEHPSYEECMETIMLVKENASRMEHLVLDLLHTYSAGEKLKKEACNLREICDKNCKAQAELDHKNVTYKVSGELTIQGEPLLIERAIANLISNAFRYNHVNGSVFIQMSGNKLTISDTGIGISEEHLERIFEPFYRVDISRSRVLGGSGLGLSIVKQILDSHNAQITISSQPEKGTDIQISFEG